MDQHRAENLYYYLRKQNTPQREIDVIIKQLIDTHNISLYNLDRRYRSRIGYSPNRYDINSYGTVGSRTMNQTREIQKKH